MTNELLARIDLLTEQLEEYKSRNEKAIEYIEKNKHLSMFADLRKDGVHNYDLECDADDLLDILQGVDKE